MKKDMIKFVAISGSLRSNSSNDAVLRVASRSVLADATFTVYEGLGALPHFNDSTDPADTVKEFRALLKEADGIIICSPEYAFGVPGSLKNAIDWTVSSGEFVNKPTALITAATGGNNAHAALLLTFTALSANITEESKLVISFVRSKMNAAGEISDQATIDAIQRVMNALLDNIEVAKAAL